MTVKPLAKKKAALAVVLNIKPFQFGKKKVSHLYLILGPEDHNQLPLFLESGEGLLG